MSRFEQHLKRHARSRDWNIGGVAEQGRCNNISTWFIASPLKKGNWIWILRFQSRSSIVVQERVYFNCYWFAWKRRELPFQKGFKIADWQERRRLKMAKMVIWRKNRQFSLSGEKAKMGVEGINVKWHNWSLFQIDSLALRVRRRCSQAALARK